MTFGARHARISSNGCVLENNIQFWVKIRLYFKELVLEILFSKNAFLYKRIFTQNWVLFSNARPLDEMQACLAPKVILQ